MQESSIQIQRCHRRQAYQETALMHTARTEKMRLDRFMKLANINTNNLDDPAIGRDLSFLLCLLILTIDVYTSFLLQKKKWMERQSRERVVYSRF
jgi:hypothetical protein